MDDNDYTVAQKFYGPVRTLSGAADGGIHFDSLRLALFSAVLLTLLPNALMPDDEKRAPFSKI